MWPLLDQSAASIPDTFLHWYVLDKRALEQLLTDQGQKFFLKIVKGGVRFPGNKNNPDITLPSPDGQNSGALMAMLCQQVNEAQSDRDLHIPGVLAAYTIAPYASTGFSQFYLMYGRESDPPMEAQLCMDLGKKRGPSYPCRSRLESFGVCTND